jgi:transmembrane sensor
MAQRPSKVHPHILEEATSWFIDFNEGDVDGAGRDRFNEWLRRSPEHVRAYLQASAFWEDADALGRRPDLDIEALVARAATEHNIHLLDGTGGAREASAARALLAGPRWSRRPAALAATLVIAIGCGVAAWHGAFSRSTYAAGIGEQRSITLDDGSSVEINSRSRLTVRYTETRREIELLEGQALFSVARDPSRPFIVSAGDARVRAIGTRFDVYRRPAGTVVTVVEGRVAVVSQRESAREDEVLVGPGEQIRVTPRSASPPEPANVEAATAWTEKKLVFKSTPLREAVEEFNRYNRRQLVIRDPRLHDFHVSGIFPSTDSSRMVELLRQRFGVAVESDGEEIAIHRASGDADER